MMVHFLSWGKSGAGSWVDETTLKESVFDLDLEVLIQTNSCS